MFQSLGSLQSNFFRYAQAAVVSLNLVQSYIFSSGNYSGSSPTALKNQVTTTNDGSYAGANTDVNIADSPYTALNLANNMSIPDTVWSTANTGITITLRMKIISSRNATCNIIGTVSSNAGNPLGSNRLWFSTNPSTKATWIWCTGNGSNGVSGFYISTGWAYFAIVLGRDLTTGTLSANAASLTTDYNNGNATYSSANISSLAQTVNSVSLVNGTSLTGANLFGPFSVGTADVRLANIRVFQRALTIAEIQADYAT
jgi:hypothetical protein